ncbi:hypothetical protein TNCV_4095831 [Trichonephila clavipes]|uniref:Uncharacterized protein n=1 Tax=Trichonephila clavipes TaxID=2585209 RepID=A0A8X6SIR8_TRICX|nr:hypothetical protein TNCV_4095831 [Trichonephila clavipes]
MQGTDRLIQTISRKVWQNQKRLQTVFDPPVGTQKPLLPFIRSFEATESLLWMGNSIKADVTQWHNISNLFQRLSLKEL